MEISDLEAYIQAVRRKHGLWNAVMTVSLFHFPFFFNPFIALMSLCPADMWGELKDRFGLPPLITSSSFYSLLAFSFSPALPLLPRSPSPRCFRIFNGSTISCIRLSFPCLLSHYVRFSDAAYSKHSAGIYLSGKMLSSSRMKGVQCWFEIRGYLLSDWLCCLCGF